MCIIPTSCGVSFRVQLFLARLRCDSDANRTGVSRFPSSERCFTLERSDGKAESLVAQKSVEKFDATRPHGEIRVSMHLSRKMIVQPACGSAFDAQSYLDSRRYLYNCVAILETRPVSCVAIFSF